MAEFFASGFKLLERGGPVMLPLALVGTAMVYLILERLAFFFLTWRSVVSRIESRREGTRRDRWIQEARLAEVRQQLFSGLAVLRALVTISSLLGLLGTISGMIAIFEKLSEIAVPTMAALSPGIARATIPTMVGMALSIVGLISWYRLCAFAERTYGNLRSRI